MLKKRQRPNAQSLGEYTVMISIAILAIMAMTYFIQRGFQARANDARRYMMSELDTDIRDIHQARTGQAYNGTMEYEPYYLNKDNNMANDGRVTVKMNGVAGTYNSHDTQATDLRSVSVELPAQD